MPRFIYKAGYEFERGDDPGRTAKLPADTTAFGIEFLKGQPTRVEPDMFEDQKQFAHAVAKLRGNPHFEEAPDIEDATYVEVKPAKRGKAKFQVEGTPDHEEIVVLDTREK